jgi:cytochrome c nitrite reductase small subunit
MRLLQPLIPPDRWKLPVAILLGLFAGLFFYTFYISNAISYLSDNPKTCMNCHVMTTQYATWLHSSHRETATCNDCHVPHTNPVATYYFKAMDGMRHATIFTLRNEPQVIRIRDAGMAVVQENCKRCHGYMNENVSSIEVVYRRSECNENKVCWECHREVPHGRVNSLSATPSAMVPLNESPVPGWLKKMLSNK